jgi:hypothetical protein
VRHDVLERSLPVCHLEDHLLGLGDGELHPEVDDRGGPARVVDVHVLQVHEIATERDATQAHQGSARCGNQWRPGRRSVRTCLPNAVSTTAGGDGEHHRGERRSGPRDQQGRAAEDDREHTAERTGDEPRGGWQAARDGEREVERQRDGRNRDPREEIGWQTARRERFAPARDPA